MRLGKSNLSAVEKITIVLMNLLHLPISALFHQDIILHIQAVYQWQVRSMHSLIRVWFLNPFRLPNAIPFTELVREPFQQLLWLVLCERFRQSDNQFPCFDTLSLCSASLKFLLAFPCKVAPKGIISGTVGGVKVLLP